MLKKTQRTGNFPRKPWPPTSSPTPSRAWSSSKPSPRPRIQSSSTHGTGCAFSTAIACALALGANLPTAVTSAKAFVRRAIQRAPGLGHGKGPMGWIAPGIG